MQARRPSTPNASRSTSPPLSRAKADELAIAGLVACSSVDWPGKLVATVFVQGCPWRCPYCHNHAIIDVTTPGKVPFSAVDELLANRRGLLDGVVFSGGEPLRQPAIADALERVGEAGFGRGLHTAGPYPRRLRTLASERALEWVGLDIKALPADYIDVAGSASAGRLAWESLDVVLDSGIDYEVRVTVYPKGPDPVAIGRELAKRGVATVAVQRARERGAPEGFVACGPDWAASWARTVESYRGFGFGTLIVRE